MALADKLNHFGLRLKKYLANNPKKILFFLIFLYVLIFSFFCLYKYSTFNYVGLDLAIFNQVFYNSSQGNLFGLTIHPHSYLGDHFEIFIVLLLPFYFILKSSAILLVLQSLFLGLSAWPLFLIARKKLSSSLALFVCLLYLSNVFVHNINAYEFHILPFAIFLLFFTFYFYQERKFGLFMLFLGLSLLVREDVSLVIIMFGVLAAIEKRKWFWVAVPVILGLGWFIFAMKMTGLISGYGQYKFIRYYGWLGADVKSIILAVINHPWPVIKHFFSGTNISFLVGIFVPFGFLPLLKPKYLLLPILVFFQIILLASAGGLALEIHYTSLFIPFLFIALIFVFDKIFYQASRIKILKILKREKAIFLTLLFLITLYSALVIGPAYYFAKNVFAFPKIKNEVSLRRYFINQIPEKAAVAGGFHFLPALSSREKVYSLSYQYLGYKQYSDLEYEIPDDVEYVLFDYNDFLYYQFLYRETDGKNIAGAERIRNLIEKNNLSLINYIDKFLLYKKNTDNNLTPPYQKLAALPEQIDSLEKNYSSIILKGLKSDKVKTLNLENKEYRILPLSFYWESLEKTDYDYQLKFSFINSEKEYTINYPLSAFYPTHDWQAGEKIEVNYELLIPETIKNNFQLKVSVYRPEGRMGLDKDKVFRPQISNLEDLGEIDLLWITL